MYTCMYVLISSETCFIYVYIYMYIIICVYICIYIYVYVSSGCDTFGLGSQPSLLECVLVQVNASICVNICLNFRTS